MRAFGLLLVLSLGVAGMSCGGGDQCSEGCARMKSCAEKLNCAAMDPMQQLSCNQSKKALLATDCGPLGTYCPSEAKARFERAASCSLSNVNCECQ